MDTSDSFYPYPAYVIDTSGQVVATLPRASHVANPEGPNYEGFIPTPTMGWIGEGLVSFSPLVSDENGMHFELGGYWDLNGETVLSLSGYSEGYAFCDGYAVVRSKETNQYGYIDKTGKEVIPCVCDSASGFQDGLAFVLTGEKWGVIDKQGQTVISPQYDDVYGANNGLISVEKDGKCGMVDRDNQVVVPFEYDDITEFMDGVAYAIKDGTLYILTKDQGPTVGGFSDVYESDYFAAAVLWAAEQNITNGAGGGKFDLNGTLTYDQMITFMCRAAGVDTSGDWSGKAMKWAADNGLTEGLTVTTKGDCPRCNVVYFLWKQMA